MAKFKKFHALVIAMRREMKTLPKTRTPRLAFLIKWSHVQCRADKGLPAQERRRRFNRSPRARKLDSLNCWVCARAVTLVRHHIIQIQHGGGNWHINVIGVCEACHAEVHPWLDASSHPIVGEAQQLDVVPF